MPELQDPDELAVVRPRRREKTSRAPLSRNRIRVSWQGCDVPRSEVAIIIASFAPALTSPRIGWAEAVCKPIARPSNRRGRGRGIPAGIWNRRREYQEARVLSRSLRAVLEGGEGSGCACKAF